VASLSPEKREELREASREAAAAFLEDLPHIREIVAKKDPSRAEIRRLSNILRRLLVERDIAAVAQPRLGKVLLRAPDNNSAYRAERKLPFMFFASGRATILGGWAATVWAHDIHRTNPFQRVDLPIIEGDKDTELRLDTFLSQKVLCYRGRWVSRQDVIKYVANVASGVHSGTPDEPAHLTLAHIRGAVSYSLRDGGVHVEMFPTGVDNDDPSFKHAPDAFDPVLVELLAAATFLANSPFVSQLEEQVRQELSGDSRP
jgi:hypothetical protein